MSSVLCDLPCELIEMIFRHLSALEIYYSFNNLNRRFDALIENYNYLSLDFRFEPKDVFDYYTIKLIKPFSISALTLSDGDETYGQIDLFFSMFKIGEFVNLRSICFESVYPSSLVWFLSEMVKLSNLLSVRSESLKPSCDLSITQFSSLTNLKYLYLPKNIICDLNNCLSFPKLSNIEMSCHAEDIQHTFNIFPSLRSLNLSITPYASNLRSSMKNPMEDCLSINQFSCPHLTRLSVKMDNGIGKIFNWKEIKELIGGFCVHLKYLRLELEVTLDVLDGEKWENFLKKFLSLKIFHVKFSSHDIVDWEEILDRFRSHFWCEEKQWYFIADNSLRSMSCDNKIRRILPINQQIPSHTAPNDDWFYSDSFLVFDTDEYTDNFLETSKHLQRLLNGETLFLTGQLETFSIELLITLLKNRVNLLEITRIHSTTSPVSIDLLNKLKKEMPDLSEMTVLRLSVNENNVTHLPRFDSIRQIDYRSQLPQQMTKHFIQIFSNLEHLVIEIELPEQIFELINQLIKLKSARFSYNSIDHQNDKNFIINRDEILKQTRLCDPSFTFKNDETSHQISFWINPSTSNKKTPQTSIKFYHRKTEIIIFFLFLFSSILYLLIMFI